MLLVKVGGSKGIDYTNFLKDLADLSKKEKIIFIHGASEELNEVSTKLGYPPQTVISESGFESRRTDRKTLEIMEMVYSGKYNKMFVEKLQGLGVNAIGLSGMDGRLLEGKRKIIKVIEDGKKKIIRDDYTGKLENVNTGLLNLLLDNGYMPTICVPAISYENEAISFENDRACALIASKMGIDTIVILSNTKGLLRDLNDQDSLVERIEKDKIDEFMDKFAKTRMKKKLHGVKEALEMGVKRVILADARVNEPIKNALAGNGTTIE